MLKRVLNTLIKIIIKKKSVSIFQPCKNNFNFASDSNYITFGTTVETKKPNKYTKKNTSVVQKKNTSVVQKKKNGGLQWESQVMFIKN